MDYIAALNQLLSQGVTPDNNSAVLYIQAAGPDALFPEIRQQYLQMLGAGSLAARSPFFVDYSIYAQSRPSSGPQRGARAGEDDDSLSAELSAATSQPWSNASLPLMAEWLQAMDQPLAVIIESTKRPRRFDPLLSDSNPPLLINAVMPMVQSHRAAARALTARAMFQLNAGNIAAAWQDLLACHRLSRLTGQGRTIIEMLVADAVENLACVADQALVAHGNLTTDQARQMFTDLQNLPPLPHMADAVDLGERYMFLDCAQALADHGLGQIGPMINLLGDLGDGASSVPLQNLSGLNAIKIRFDAVAQVGNPWFDRLAAALRQSTWMQKMSALAEYEADAARVLSNTSSTLLTTLVQGPAGDPSGSIGQVLLLMTQPAGRDAAEAEARTAQYFELTRLGFLLAAYRAETGRYPAQLSELAPKYVTQVPVDLFTGGPLAYRPQPDGYLLYSVGPNGRDDGGLRHEDRTAGAHEVADDLVVQVPIKPEYQLGRN